MTFNSSKIISYQRNILYPNPNTRSSQCFSIVLSSSAIIFCFLGDGVGNAVDIISSTSFSILDDTILCSCKALEGSGVVVSFEIFSVKQSTSSFILLFSSVEGVNRDGIKLNDGLHNGVVISPSLEIPGGQFSSSIRK